jgi:hypothetical protein
MCLVAIFIGDKATLSPFQALADEYNTKNREKEQGGAKEKQKEKNIEGANV